MARFASLYRKWDDRIVPSGDGHKITLVVRLYPSGTRTHPKQSFGVYADNVEGVGLTNEADLAQLFAGLACSLGDALEARRA